MTPTISDIFSKELIMKEIYRCIPDLSDGDPKEDTQSSETWIGRNRRTFSKLQNQLEKWSPDLSSEQKIEVIQPDEVILFCQGQSLVKYLGLAENLIKKHLPSIRRITFSVAHDHETPERWVRAEAEILGDVDQIIEREDNFIKEWVASVPYPERDKIRLLCDII